MTLCVVWRRDDAVHFASDSRLKTDANSYADVAIKVHSIPFRVYSPTDHQTRLRSLDFEGEIAMCFAGSAVNSLFVKESVADILMGLQYAPGYTDVSMNGLSNFIFKVYRLVSTEICSTALGKNGRAGIVIAGYCPTQQRVRTYFFNTDDQNNHTCTEILLAPNDHFFIGNGKSEAEAALPKKPTDHDYLKTLKAIIDDPKIVSVGGTIQYGRFEGREFKTFGIVEFSDEVHYWRGALDLNSDEFNDTDIFVPSYNYIDPFKTFSKKAPH